MITPLKSPVLMKTGLLALMGRKPAARGLQKYAEAMRRSGMLSPTLKQTGDAL